VCVPYRLLKQQLSDVDSQVAFSRVGQVFYYIDLPSTTGLDWPHERLCWYTHYCNPNLCRLFCHQHMQFLQLRHHSFRGRGCVLARGGLSEPVTLSRMCVYVRLQDAPPTSPASTAWAPTTRTLPASRYAPSSTAPPATCAQRVTTSVKMSTAVLRASLQVFIWLRLGAGIDTILYSGYFCRMSTIVSCLWLCLSVCR
jgi:hypothetical protein